MIDRDEIDATCEFLGVHAADVQRDYLYGWLLAGLYGDSPLAGDRLVLKGGNAFRKGYFANTRFSGDLDFAAPTGLDADQFLDVLNNACRMIQARTGVEFDIGRNAQTGQRSIDSSKTVYKFTLYFKNFYGKTSTMTIALRMDVTEFGRLYLPIQQRNLIHPYSDQADCATTLAVVSIEEALADKLKCLLQRHSSNDLFDLVYAIFINNDIAVDKTLFVTTFLRKTIFEPSPQAALKLLLAVPFEIMRRYWKKIVCAAASRMDFTAAVQLFTDELQALFSSFRRGEGNQLAFYPAELRTPIMQAGQAQTLLRITYDGIPRLVEPYSLAFKWSKRGAGQEYLYVWDQTGGRSGPGIKSWFNWKITSLETTDVTFEPRYEIELAKAGEYGERTTFSSPRSRAGRSGMARPHRQARYRVRCASCQREFDRTGASTVMRPHNDSYGNPCRGRRAHRI
ncbi:nucleotidyl transferase AbiEii/AbiGii toxin family protein [Amycolatopsis sp. NBC_00348]|uniref:nucleotidyl transferase AbiEii/AbiGii toxin family protein n=1 Tax=Amycolatopsis sp. NBC_00348 TaxID=2975956 RepID=UPI002E264BD6